MANLQEVEEYKDKLTAIFTGLQQSDDYKKMQKGYPPTANLEASLKAFNEANSRIPAPNKNMSDDEWTRAKASIKSSLTLNSDTIRNVVGPNGPLIALGDQNVSPTDILNEMTVTQPSQYINPTQPLPPPTPSPPPDKVFPPVEPVYPIEQQAPIDRAKIETEGERQFKQQQDQIAQEESRRATDRTDLGKLLTQQATMTFGTMLPNIAEDAQAAHLYDSTGYGQEVARQQSQLISGIANQLGQVGLQDVNLKSQAQASALQGLQGYQGQGLERTFNLQDYQRQSDLARQLGAASAPQIKGTGKGGAILGGAGSGAATGAVVGGPVGAVVGGLAGAGLGGAVGGK